MSNINRRTVLRGMASSSLLALLGANLSACGGKLSSYPPLPTGAKVAFDHGVASGDPMSDRVIIWTRATPDTEGRIDLRWEMASDSAFSNIVASGDHATDPSIDYTVKVDVTGLEAGSGYYYRFFHNDTGSPVGRTRTLPVASVESVSFVVLSCTNYPAGYFHPLKEALKGEYDAVLHVGDYIYEYGQGQYATEDAESLGRVPNPIGETLSLADYRTRYAQYHTDPDLQALHGRFPFILVWDDHEVADDAWRDGALNHDPATEGDYGVRRQEAMQAYYEWLPIRPPASLDQLYRAFRFGDLVDLIMLDTRHVGRDKQLDFSDFTNGDIIDDVSLNSARMDATRTLLGSTQKQWLLQQLTDANARWQVLGQQILVARMLIPAQIMAEYNKLANGGGDLGPILVLISEASAAKAKDPADRTPEEQALLDSIVPYNLDVWDGYGAEQDEIMFAAQQLQRRLVVLSGDTHNGWASQLHTNQGAIAGVEFAGPSVSSPGLDQYLDLSDESFAGFVENSLTGLIDDLYYSNAFNRGIMQVTFSADEVVSEWIYVDSIKSTQYSVSTTRGKRMRASADTLLLEDA